MNRLDRLQELLAEVSFEQSRTVLNVFVGALSVRASDADWDACLKTTRSVVEDSSHA
jgi:hypothetical protein